MRKYINRFFDGIGFSVTLISIATIAIFTGNEVIGTILMSELLAISLVLTEDILPLTEGVLITTSVAIRCKYSFNDFWHYKILAIPIFVFIIARFFIYPVKFKKGKCFYGIVAASVATTLGGVGILQAQQYFSETSIFYIVMLGFAQVLFYCFFCGEFSKSKVDLADKFCRAVSSVIPMICICLLQEYISRWDEFMEIKTVLAFQWRNNCATILMLAMPFAFYFSLKKFRYFFLGILSYVAIVFTGSRGGLLFGLLELGICIGILFVYDKVHRKYIVITIGVCLFVLLVEIKYVMEILKYVIDRLLDPEENRIRLEHIPRSWDDFKANPLFGRGLIYMGNRDLHKSAKFTLCWYHNSIAQIIGSFGLCGVAGYAILLAKRIETYKRNFSVFSTTLIVSYIGLELMSLVNPGIFVPFPYLTFITMCFAVMEFGKPEIAQITQVTAEIDCDEKN